MLHKPFLIRSVSWQADRAGLEFVRGQVFIERKSPSPRSGTARMRKVIMCLQSPKNVTQLAQGGWS